MQSPSGPETNYAPSVREVFNQQTWILDGVGDEVAKQIAELPGTHSRNRFGPNSYDIDVGALDEPTLLSANSTIASRLRDIGFCFWDAKEMSPVGHVKWLKNAGLIEGEFLEVYATRTKVRRTRPF